MTVSSAATLTAPATGASNYFPKFAELHRPLSGRKNPFADKKSPPADLNSVSADKKSPSADLKSSSADLKSPSADLQSPSADLQSPSADLNSASAGLKSPSAGLKSAIAGREKGPASQVRPLKTINLRPKSRFVPPFTPIPGKSGIRPDHRRPRQSNPQQFAPAKILD